MKSFFLIMSLLLYGGLLGATDFSWSFLGEPNKIHSKNHRRALFDKATSYNTNRVIWDSKYAPKGCGVVFEFNKPMIISRVEVFTAKPNTLLYAPLKTEFILWDDAKSLWGDKACINDVTGKANNTKFTSASIKTKWDAPSKATNALKILMYGTGIWLTEINIYIKNANGQERLLQPNKPISLLAKSEIVKPSSFGGGASVDIRCWDPKSSWVGNPNVLNRKDRVVFHFDLSEYLQKGKVKQAILVLPLQPFGAMKGNRLELECFKSEHAPVFKMDLISNDVSPVNAMLIDAKSQVLHHLDITKLVNDRLSRGEGTIAFRVRNMTIEKVGNRKNKAEGVIVDVKKLKLEIVK